MDFKDNDILSTNDSVSSGDDDYISSDDEQNIVKKFDWVYDYVSEKHLTDEVPLMKIIPNKDYGEWREWFDKNYSQIENIAPYIDQEYKEYKICPLKRDIFACLEYTSKKNLKVVILGMDPYHTVKNGIPVAHGLSFSTLDDEVPKSLKNIFQEIKNEYPEYKIPTDGNLENWAKQGILLLNSALTARQSIAGSHIKKAYWVSIIQPLIAEIILTNPKCIFVLWGRDSQKCFEQLNKKEGITTLESPHPSGLSAYKGFFGNGHFKKINEILVSQGQDEIEW